MVFYQKVTERRDAMMLGSRIAMLRRLSGLSQAELAKRLCITPSAVGMYEQNRREPSVDTLISIAGVFNITLDYLLTGKPRPPQDHTLRQRSLSTVE